MGWSCRFSPMSASANIDASICNLNTPNTQFMGVRFQPIVNLMVRETLSLSLLITSCVCVFASMTSHHQSFTFDKPFKMFFTSTVIWPTVERWTSPLPATQRRRRATSVRRRLAALAKMCRPRRTIRTPATVWPRSRPSVECAKTCR